jgi:hypothetical protein
MATNARNRVRQTSSGALPALTWARPDHGQESSRAEPLVARFCGPLCRDWKRRRNACEKAPLSGALEVLTGFERQCGGGVALYRRITPSLEGAEQGRAFCVVLSPVPLVPKKAEDRRLALRMLPFRGV